MKVGDVVYLKSGSPPLTIVQLNGGNASVMWFAHEMSAPQGAEFPLDALTSTITPLKAS